MARTISVIGTGYLGAVHAAGLARMGHTVVGVDRDAGKVDALRAARAPLYEPGLDALLREMITAGRLTFTTEMAAARDADVHFVCVGTPQLPGEYAADTTQVFSAVEALAPHLRPDSLVVGKSTVPVGTADAVRLMLEKTAPAGDGVRLAWNPEFLREGLAIRDTLAPDRLVYGVQDLHQEEDVALLDEVYAVALAAGTPRLVLDLPTAELVKVAANAFLATKISFINAMAEVCEAAGGDVVRLADAIGMDKRIGREYLGAGLGFGGGCLPKDIRAFMARAGELGADQALTFLREVDAINGRRRARMVDLARDQCGGTLRSRRLAVLGAAFKPDSDDVRDSPALDVAAAAQRAGATVTVHDPRALPAARLARPELRYAPTVEEAVEGVHVTLHLTEWQVYRELDPVALGRIVRERQVIDGRNALDVSRWQSAGWIYRALGRPGI